MSTEDELRQRMLRLTNEAGVSQKALANHVGVSESWLSHWLRDDGEAGPPKLQILDAFNAYLASLALVVRELATPPKSKTDNAAAPLEETEQQYVEEVRALATPEQKKPRHVKTVTRRRKL